MSQDQHNPPQEENLEQVQDKPKGKSKSVSLSSYKPPKGSEDTIHVEFERAAYDPTTGERLSKPYISKHNPRDFALMLKTDQAGLYAFQRLGLRCNAILYVPDGITKVNVEKEVKGNKSMFVPLLDVIEELSTKISKPKQ